MVKHSWKETNTKLIININYFYSFCDMKGREGKGSTQPQSKLKANNIDDDDDI